MAKLHSIFIPGKFIIKTPMMEALLNKILGWQANNVSGGVVLGEARIGKSAAMDYLIDNLKNRAGESIPGRKVSVAKRDRKTIASIFRNICLAVGKDPKRTATADQMANDLIHYFAELSLGNQTRQVVLMVDEMQRLSLHQFEAFAELYDGLTAVGTNLSVIFVGNESDSSPTIDSIGTSNYELIRGRFFTHQTKYFGITNKKEIEAILNEFDNWKVDGVDKPTTTEHFLPELYDTGWRYADLSKQIWSIYKDEYMKKHGFNSWPLQYFMRSAKILLTDYLPVYGVDSKKSLEKMIIKSILASQIVGKND